MTGPPAICPKCGWEGEVPNFFVGVTATSVTFQGGSCTCPKCGGQANIVSGTYDIDLNGIVRLVRDADLTLAEITRLRGLVREARRSGTSPEDFAAANPKLAPVVNLIIQQKPGRDWLTILFMVLAILVPYLQTAEYHTDDERDQIRPTANPSTLVLSDEQIARIEQSIRTQMAKPNKQLVNKPPKRRRRPPKRYGQKKRHR